jgi:hypothetical protein
VGLETSYGERRQWRTIGKEQGAMEKSARRPRQELAARPTLGFARNEQCCFLIYSNFLKRLNLVRSKDVFPYLKILK